MRAKNFVPGKVLCVDECMSAWRGQNGKYCVEGMPHVTKIIRKPEGVGAELKSIACGETGVLLQLEIMEGADAQKEKEHYDTTKSEGTAVVLRLTKPWHNSKRLVVADSAFGSVKTCKALAKRNMFFMGMVKTARKEFPVDYFKEWIETKPLRGKHCMVTLKTPPSDEPTTSIESLPTYACCWNDRKAKSIVSNCGDASKGAPAVRTRHRIVENDDGVSETERYKKEIERPQMIEKFFEFFSTIDVHDHFRQGSLAMEKTWKTHSWWHRVFCSVFAMCVVDAYMMYRYEFETLLHNETSMLDFSSFRSGMFLRCPA